MTSTIFSRVLPIPDGSPSIYETIQQHDDESTGSDIEGGLEQDDEQSILRKGGRVPLPQEVHNNTGSRRWGRTNDGRRPDTSITGPRPQRTQQPKWMRRGQKLLDVEEAEDDVPASLLIEDRNNKGTTTSERATLPRLSAERQRQWAQVQEQSRPRTSSNTPQPQINSATPAVPMVSSADAKVKAMWRWNGIENIDNFLFDVYDYYLSHGYWSTILRRGYSLATVAFIVGFSLFLTQCIDYRQVKGSTEMSEILIPRCASKMGLLPNVLLWATTFGWICKAYQYARDIPRLNHLHDFYHHLLDIPEPEIASIAWQEVVSRLMALRDSNPNLTYNKNPRVRGFLGTQNKQRLDAHDIANRLMRKDNYLIAMVNKDVLDMTLPIPFLRNRQLFTRTLEWNLNQCIMDFVFNERGQIKQLFLKDTHRKALSEALRRRFVFAGFASLLTAPFLISYFLVQNFFVYFNEYQKNPAQIGSRQYNTLAQWKFREFNELWHLFERRLNMSQPFAVRYINQFPKDKVVQSARFVSFVSGAIVSVLGLATVLDQESFFGFEITPGRTTIFYLTLFGSIWAMAHGLVPEENAVYDPAYSLQEVIDFTHYQPSHWNSRLHTIDVKQEFEQLYQMKIVVFCEEILSLIFTPFVLWYSLPKCSERVIDFFREFTVHVDGLGYVCSFAEFTFQMHGKQAVGHDAQTDVSKPQPSQGLRDEYFATKDNKLEQSYWGFMNDYARNPKADVRFPYANNRRRTNWAPPSQSQMSPAVPQDTEQQGYTTGRQTSVSSPRRPIPLGTPKHSAHPGASPLQSLLLDAHHQPSMYGFNSHAQMHTSKAGPSSAARVLPETIPEQPLDATQSAAPLRSTYTPRDQGEADLGSWNNDQAESTSEDEDVDQLTTEGAGVIGLIKQLHKAQAEGRASSMG